MKSVLLALAARFDPATYDEVRRLWIAHSKVELAQDVDGLLATLTDDCVYETSGHRWEGIDGARRFYTSMFAALGDINQSATDVVIGPQGVLVAAEMTATHRSSWLGEGPTGQRFACEFLALLPWDRKRRLFTGEKIWWTHPAGFPGVVQNAM